MEACDGATKAPDLFLSGHVRELGLEGIGELDVADGARRLLDVGGQPGIQLLRPHPRSSPASACSAFVPPTAVVQADPPVSIRYWSRSYPGPDESARWTATMARSGSLMLGVERGDGAVVPLGDLAQEDAGQGGAVEFQAGADAGDVVAERPRRPGRRGSAGWCPASAWPVAGSAPRSRRTARCSAGCR